MGIGEKLWRRAGCGELSLRRGGCGEHCSKMIAGQYENVKLSEIRAFWILPSWNRLKSITACAYDG